MREETELCREDSRDNSLVPKTSVIRQRRAIVEDIDIQDRIVIGAVLVALFSAPAMILIWITQHIITAFFTGLWEVLSTFFVGLRAVAGLLGLGTGLALLLLLALALWYIHDRFRTDIKARNIKARTFKVDPQSGNYNAYFDTAKMFIAPALGKAVPPVPTHYSPRIHIVSQGHKEIAGPALAPPGNPPEAPKTPTLSEQLQNGSTAPNEVTSIIGYTDGKAFRATIFDNEGNLFNSCFIFGDQGHGKSTFGTYLAALTILQGGKLIVIDPESEDPQALTKRLGPLVQERYLLCPIADTPEKAKQAVKEAREQIEIIGNHPVLLLIDEFTLIARQTASGRGPWAKAGADILDISEEYATRGRKKRCRVICLGQIPKATRAGNTEVRDSMATVCFNLKKERAQRVLETDEAALAPSLKIGEIILAPSATTYRLQLPYPDKDGLERVASLGRDIKWLVKPSEDDADFWSPQNQTTMARETDEITVRTGPLQNVTDEPVELLGTGPISPPDDLMMTDLQIQQFEILYKALGNIKECLRRIDGCNNRHHRHASSIVKLKNLKRY